MNILYGIITPHNLSTLKFPEGWSLRDFNKFYRQGSELYYIVAFESGFAGIEYVFLKIFNNGEEFKDWRNNNLDIISTKYDNINNKASVLCSNGFIYSTNCYISWTKQDCINFISKIKFEDFNVAVIPFSKLIQYQDALNINKENVFTEQGFTISGHKFCLVKVPNCGLDLSYIINEFNLENNLNISGTFVFESCFEYYKFWKEVIV